jgi:acyl-CoA synthetase (AMP-forming)/AMP-acid ligase II
MNWPSRLGRVRRQHHLVRSLISGSVVPKIGRSADARPAATAHHINKSIGSDCWTSPDTVGYVLQRRAMIFRSPQPDITIPDISLTQFVLRHADRLVDKAALIDGASGRTLTYAELAENVRRAAAGLARRGFRKGEVLAICAPNVLEYAVAFHAAVSLGGIVTMINPLCTVEELADRLSDSNATFLLATPESLDRAQQATLRSPVRELFVFGKAPPATSFASLLSGDQLASPNVPINPQHDLAALPYSSGTGGLPKGVMLTHRNLVAGLRLFAAGTLLTEDETMFSVPPFFHLVGLAVLNLVLSQGATLVIMPRFDFASSLSVIQTYGVTCAYLVPPIVIELAKHPIVDDYDLSSLRVIHSGAAPLGEAVARACADRLGCPLMQGYALTEGFPAMRMAPTDPNASRVTSVGRCLPNTECKVIDPETGSELGPGQPGELWLRGPQIMQGYLHQPEATAEAIDHEGWLRTGDIGWADDEGYITVVDRLKELIKYKGYQVAPAELEAVLLSHPAVADVAVIPSPDAVAGEVPKAFVVLRELATSEELMAFVAAHVAPYKKVRRLEVVEQIPKSPSGKILRRVLVERERASDPVLV